MTFALIALVAVLAAALVVQTEIHRRERKSLVDRVIARHTGEVIALDREASRPTKKPDRETEGSGPVVGMS